MTRRADTAGRARRTVDVTVLVVAEPGEREAGYRMLIDLAARVAGADSHGLHLAHHCDHCGSSEHGRPLVRRADGRPVAHVSLSRAGGLLALAAALTAPVGIDIESLAAVRAATLDCVAFDDDERAAIRALALTQGPAAADRMRTLAWTAKEAALKALGAGLRTDPRDLHLDLAAPDGHPHLRPGTTPLTLQPLPAPLPLPDASTEPEPDILGTIAATTTSPLRIHLLTQPQRH